jgi:tetratricopeptide (TPR) repeat protein
MLIIGIVAILIVSLEMFALVGVGRAFRWLISNRAYIAWLLGFVILVWLVFESYYYWGGKGVFAELLALFFAAFYLGGRIPPKVHRCRLPLRHLQREKISRDKMEECGATKTVNWDVYFVSAILFLVCFPFSVFAHAIGLVPGLLLILAFAYFFAGATRGERSIHNVLAIVLLGLFVWLWGEAGRQGLVVMPVDLPEGRDDMSFTADGVANAIETELKDFGSHETEYGATEASRIFSRDFPRNLWFKGTEARPPMLEGLQASHVIVGTAVEGFPLFNLYHIFRHLRGTPLLEGQILLGADGSMTLALRRSNYPLECSDKTVSDVVLKTSLSSTAGAAVEELWKASSVERTSGLNIPDARGCRENWFRWVLDRLDIMNPPASSEERLANVTIQSLSGDEALASAIHLAAIEAMSHISPERLAIYYDDTAVEAASALYYYKRSLPDLLVEAHNAPTSLSDYPRQRLAHALIRIGDLEHCEDADQAYSLAAHLLPHDLHVQARVGYGYLVRYKQRTGHWKPSTAETCGTEDAIRDLAIHNLKDAISSADPDLQGQSSPDSKLPLYPKSRNASFARLGLKRWRDTLAWASSNLAYMLASSRPSANGCPSELRPTLDAPQCLAALATRANSRDVRAAITREFVRVKMSSMGGDLDCDALLKELSEIDPAELSKDNDRYDRAGATLHNTLLMEDQLIAIYQPCENKSGGKGLYHKVLLRSLLTLDYVQGRTEKPTDFSASGRLDDYQNDAAELDRKKLSDESFSDQATLQLLFLDTIAENKEKDRRTPLVSAKDREEFCMRKQDEPRVRSLCARLNSFSCGNGDVYASQALEAANGMPEDYFVRENLGIARFKAGRYREALSSFQNAVRLRPSDPELRYMLAFALQENDRPQEARDQLRYGQLLDPKGWRPQLYQSFLQRCPKVPGYVPPEAIEPLEQKTKSHSTKAGKAK